MSDRSILMSLEMGQDLEARAHGDLDRDGLADTVFVASSPDARFVHVMVARGRHHRQVGVLKLEPAPYRPAKVSIANAVVKVENQSGATTALDATYRYRLDPRTGRMRLIGLDARLFSRILERDGFEISWNLITGDLTTRVLQVTRSEHGPAYRNAFEQRKKRPSRPVYMEETPDPEFVMIDIRQK
jgi:hypothetical protein